MRKRTIQMTVSLTSVLFFLVTIPMSAQRRGAAEPPKAPEGITMHRDIAYVTDGHERQKLDLYIPDEGENLPLIIWIHGGAWLGGNKRHYVPKAHLKSGYAGASINYRRQSTGEEYPNVA
ncbi:MAG: hypothetical protein OXU51_15650 [Candidatus Poribacteria bacterium]|nr:hypothetical protein [Candidatus Poribacteria bacterium]